ncbi:MAG: site-2 protease family protein [Planctomycetota bacterium]|nr:site-2 protease family protein [Planctomycetota bacterium]
MLLAEPQRTPYDLHFQIFGFEIRVSPFFWLAAALLGWNLTSGIDTEFSLTDESARTVNAMSIEERAALQPEVRTDLELIESNPGAGLLLLLWIAAIFASILIHELGHAFAMRYYGIHAYIVLYHFGGLAVSDSAAGFTGMGRRGDSKQQIAISAAGPAAQLLLAALIIAILQASGRSLKLRIPFLESIIPLHSGELITSLPLTAVVYFLILPSVFWALLNLLPVYPLDGGQISRELFTIFSPRDGLRNSLILSIAAGALVAGYGLTHDDMMLGMMFGMLAFSSYQILQAYSGRGGGYGPW